MNMKNRSIPLLLVAWVAGCAPSGQVTDESDQPTEPRSQLLVDIAVGGQHACALDEAGRVYCWGDNRFGQLGVPAADVSEAAIHVAGLPKAVEVVAGDAHTCARLESGRVACWGLSTDGQAGDGRGSKRHTVRALQPTFVRGPGADTPINHMGGHHLVCPETPIEGIVDLSSGPDQTCAVHRSGGLLCWGEDDFNKLGVDEGDTTPVRCALPVAGVDDATAVTSTDDLRCARTDSEQTVCWGGPQAKDAFEQLGPPVEGASYRSPFEGTSARDLNMMAASQLREARSLALSRHHACRVGPDGKIACLKTKRDGESAPDWPRLEEVDDVTTIALAGPAGCLVDGAGSIFCAGAEALTTPLAASASDGEQPDAGPGSEAETLPPTSRIAVGGFVKLTDTDARPADGAAAACALSSAGTVHCWGDPSNPILQSGGLDGSGAPGKLLLGAPSSGQPPTAGGESAADEASCPDERAYGDPQSAHHLTLRMGERTRTFHFDGGSARKTEKNWRITLPTLKIDEDRVLEKPLLVIPRNAESDEPSLESGATRNARFIPAGITRRVDCMTISHREFGQVTIEEFRPPGGPDTEPRLTGSFQFVAGTPELGALEGSFAIETFDGEQTKRSAPPGNVFRSKMFDEWSEWHEVTEIDVTYDPQKESLRIGMRHESGGATRGLNGFSGEPGVYVTDEHVYQVKSFGESGAVIRSWRVPRNTYTENEKSNTAEGISFFESQQPSEDGPSGPRDDLPIPPPDGELAMEIDVETVTVKRPEETVVFEPANSTKEEKPTELTFDTDNLAPSDVIFHRWRNPDDVDRWEVEPRQRRQIATYVEEPGESERRLLKVGPPAPLNAPAAEGRQQRRFAYKERERQNKTVLLDPETLRPVRRSLSFDARYGKGDPVTTDVDVTYTDSGARVTAENDVQGRHQKDFPHDGPLLDRAQIPWSLAYLPLEEGYRTRFSVFELDLNRSMTYSAGNQRTFYELDGEIEPAQLTVTGTEHLERGPVDAEVYRVELTVGRADPQVYWLRKKAPHVLIGHPQGDGEPLELRYLSTEPL